MSRRRNLLLVIYGFLALALCQGCGSSSADLGQVSGTVRLDGKPAAGTRVVFTPDDGRRSVGVTDTEGHYRLAFSEDINGAALGKHSVSIEWTGEDADEDEMAEASADEPAARGKGMKIPAKYNVKTTLTAEVAPGDNVCDFELQSK